MPSYSKRKGAQFEMEAVDMLTEEIKGSKWKRIPTSGAIGTKLEIPILFSDLIGQVEGFPRNFRVEAKAGYGGKEQFTLRKEWLDKIFEEGRSTYSVPFLIGKFSGARGPNRVFVVLDLHIFSTIVNMLTDLQRRIDEEAKNMDSDTEKPIENP